jgi:hypothetical protein
MSLRNSTSRFPQNAQVAATDISQLQRFFLGEVDAYSGKFAEDTVTFSCRSLAAHLVDDKLTAVSMNQTMTAFMADQATKYGLPMPVVSIALDQAAGVPGATVQEVLAYATIAFARSPWMKMCRPSPAIRRSKAIATDGDERQRFTSRAGSRLPLPVNTPLDITLLVGENQAPTYVISDINGLLFARSDGFIGRYVVDNVQIKDSWNTIGAESIGHPYSVAGYGSHSIVYTDRFTNVVRVIDVDTGYVRPVLRADTIGEQMSAPLGLRMLPDRGSVAIIDAARRRLSVVQLDADRGPFAPSAARAFPPPPASATKRIALIGNSMVWWATH